MRPIAPQRLRITFAKGEEIKYISHLDLMRLWERTLRRARVPLAYSRGFNPRPKIAVAAPLPVGFTSRGEVMDIVLERHISPYNFARCLTPHLPPGLEVFSVEEVYPKLPSLQSQVRSAEYRAIVAWDGSSEEMEGKLHELLTAERLPRQRRGKDYDLRPLIEELWVEGKEADGWVLGMRLRAGSQGTGRPDEVLAALGLAEEPHVIQRERLLFGLMSSKN
ncbi:MAG: TIGR03936 family radical SAM-associated protein [Anaerolineae bacterium]